MKKLILINILLALCFALTSCKSKNESQQTKNFTVITVKQQVVPTQLYYEGTISPIQVEVVTTPTDGTIKKIFFKYGQPIKANDPLLTIGSTKLQQDYRDALTAFVKSKEEYNSATINFHGSKELWKAKIISNQDYLTAKNQYEDAALSYLDAKYNLQHLSEKIPGISATQLQLTADNMTAINSFLQAQHDNLTIKAKQPGIVLFPPKDTSGSGAGSGSDSNKELEVGNAVKEGQALVSIGDLSGIATTVQVSELVVNQIQPGQKVKVTITALPNIIFDGVVKAVGAQVELNNPGQQAVAMFPVTVNVAKITSQQAELIRVGMSTKIDITIQNPPQILVPISAVWQKNGINMVTVRDPATKKTQDIAVTTGATTINDVVITSGLKPGMQVMVPVPTKITDSKLDD
jgi:multidrug efflux pump subunit AcrA (membrane-fusion protein)